VKVDWKKTLGAVAPTLATGLGGPMAGVAVKMACDALGITKPDEQKLAEAVSSGNPDVLVALRKVDVEYKTRMRQLEVDLEAVNAKDRASARKSGDTIHHIPQMILGTVYTAGFIWLLVALFTGTVHVPEEQQTIANLLLGILSAGQAQVLNYFFGSSTGSKDKTFELARSKPA